eukprot:12914785-Prorocentrum_lima.AAC.1
MPACIHCAFPVRSATSMAMASHICCPALRWKIWQSSSVSGEETHPTMTWLISRYAPNPRGEAS